MTTTRRLHKVEWTNPVTAYAAAVRRTDTTNEVAWTDADGTPAFSILLPYDALGMAKDLAWNNVQDVTLTLASGRVLDAEAIKAAKF